MLTYFNINYIIFKDDVLKATAYPLGQKKLKKTC